ncbi:Sugar transferase involved in LPS biosynthesis (colanic, teichoic acid) [Pseudobutyrivibrio xylanivorans]|uniref:Sugar transferase involved in LPS biosynthesis (Colanic, teichoic acid) n=1 Tax=Pseudobutyrivibrio xylanivorans TaxID=185007 RepID=A0A1G5S4D1_PSEXY|nr:Sugar transferase involved in LPS biosynthesis (colanic, teichoic acid) [Pseudobutyrivibrio xylanivorans]
MICRQQSIYEKYVKRILDFFIALIILLLFWWLYSIIAIVVRINMGSPVIFKQPRPGMINPDTGEEKIFNLYKFRTMTDGRDSEGNLLPDAERMTAFGTMLRRSSLDEIPEVFNILMGDMSFIGPRPQLVRDMVFMSEDQRLRHTAKPGLSGLAQVMGRNAISWEKKFEWDLKYIEHVSFTGDLKIIFMTIAKVFGKGESDEELDVTLDFGDYLLQEGKVSQEEYERLMEKARGMVH